MFPSCVKIQEMIAVMTFKSISSSEINGHNAHSFYFISGAAIVQSPCGKVQIYFMSSIDSKLL